MKIKKGGFYGSEASPLQRVRAGDNYVKNIYPVIMYSLVCNTCVGFNNLISVDGNKLGMYKLKGHIGRSCKMPLK
jgi:hypothetical protein